MHIVCDEEVRDDAEKNGVDLTAFLDLLVQEAGRVTPGNPSPWELCEVDSSWGLILFAFFSPTDKALVPVALDVLLLTKGTVVSDAGQIVPRWKRLAEEVLHWAATHRKPRRLTSLAAD